MQEDDPASALNVPGWHASHLLCPSAAWCQPALHAVQAVAPVVLEKRPDLHSPQLPCPGPATNLPASHGVQDVAALPEEKPAEHLVQFVAREFNDRNVPGSHAVHDVAPNSFSVREPAEHRRHSPVCAAGAYLPLVQNSHVLSSTNSPGWQEPQKSRVGSENSPEGHSKQNSPAWLGWYLPGSQA